MTNTPLPVAGYTSQSDEKVSLVNEHKIMEERILRRIDELVRVTVPGRVLIDDDPMMVPVYDHRWLAIARTQIEQGFMALNRAVFRPQRIGLDGDKGEVMAND